jgi:hypothetical protein
MPVGGTIIDSLFIALGFAPDFSGLETFKKRAEEASTQLLTYGAAAGAVLGGLAVKAIANISDEYEQNTIALAGFFDALGISSDFNAGMKEAATTMDQIIRDAALLPGEADEYIEMFRGGLPVIKDAVPDWKVEQITEFTNKLAAIGHTLKVPHQVAAREMQELFVAGQGHATRINILFKRFLPFLRQVQGQAKLTQESFNKMTAPERLELFKASFSKLDPMLKRSASSFDAMKGAIISAAKMLTRRGGEVLFEGMKRGIAKLNAAFFTADGAMTALGKRVVDVGNSIGGMVTQAVESVAALVEWFLKSDTAMMAVKATAVLLGFAMAGLAFEKVAKGVGLLVYSLMNLKRLFTGALLVAIGLIAEDLYTFYTGGESVTGMIVTELGPAGLWLAKTVLGTLVLGLAALRFAFVRTALAAVFSMARILAPVLLLGAAIYGAIKVVGYLQDHWSEFGAAAQVAIVGVITVVSTLAGVLIAFKAAALVASLQAAAAFLLVASPVYLVIAALLAAGATVYLLWQNWQAVTGFMRENWMSFAAFLVNIPVFGPILAAIVSIGTHFDDLVAKMKAAWNSFAETMNATGLVTLPTFSEKAELAAGDGVRLPGQDTGPQGAWNSPYAPRGALPAAGTAEGPGFRPSALADEKKTGLVAGLQEMFGKFGGGSGIDIASMLGGVGGMQGAAYGGSANAPPQAMLDLVKSKLGGDTKIDQHFTFGDLKFEGDPMKPADVERFAQRVAAQVRDEAKTKNARVIRNLSTAEEY